MLTSFVGRRGPLRRDHGRRVGLLLKQVKSEEIVQAVRFVAKGSHCSIPRSRGECSNACARGRKRTSASRELSRQERNILELIADGLTNRQIAEEIHLAEKTVKNYVSNLLTKLGMERRTQAAVYAARLAEQRGDRPPE